MKRYLFVLGKNQSLSLCEISHVLQFPPHEGKIIDLSKQVGIIEFEKLQRTEDLIGLQYRLGGIQKICEIISSHPIEIFKDGFPLQKHPKRFKKARTFIENEVLPNLVLQVFLNVQDKKIMFAVSVYPYLFSKPELSVQHAIQLFNKFIKNNLKQKSNKVTYFKYPEEFLKSKDLNPIWPHHVLLYSLLDFPNAEIVLGLTKECCYIAKTIAVDNPNLRKAIDEHRPTTQFEISIPPKLAKILINFLNLPRDGILLDPFCGTGTILMMAALQGKNFVGTDVSEEKIQSTLKNLKWLNEEFKLGLKIDENKAFKLDATKLDSHFKENSIDGIATEPYLGPTLKSPLLKSEYNEIIKNEIKPTYEKSLQSMKKILKKKGQIAIISPVYKGVEKIAADFNLSKIAEDLGLKVIELIPSSIFQVKNNLNHNKKSLLIKKDQFVMRKINLFQKME